MIVREAKRLRTIKIVSFDWLEDSLLSKNRRPKRETEYLLANILEREKKKRGNEKVKIREREEEEPRKKGTFALLLLGQVIDRWSGVQPTK